MRSPPHSGHSFAGAVSYRSPPIAASLDWGKSGFTILSYEVLATLILLPAIRSRAPLSQLVPIPGLDPAILQDNLEYRYTCLSSSNFITDDLLRALTKEATWCAPKPPLLLCRSVVQVRRDGQFVGGANPVFHPQSIPPCWGPAVPALGIGLPPPGERRVVVNTEQAPSIAVLTRSSSRFLPIWEHLEMPRFDKFPWDTWRLASAMKFWEVPENSNKASE